MCLSVGLGMASQIPPKLQIPVQFVNKNNSADENNTIATSASDTSATVAGPTQQTAPQLETNAMPLASSAFCAKASTAS